MTSLTSILSDGLTLAALSPADRRAELGIARSVSCLSAAQQAFVHSMRRRYGTLDTTALRAESAESTSARTWLLRVADRLEAADRRSLEEVPDADFFTIAHL